jgi:hypothetical protein
VPANIRAGLKRSILNSIARQAADSSQNASGNLLPALESYQDALVCGIKGGRLVESTSQNGHMTKFRVPVIGDHFRQEDIVEMAEDFIEIYNDSLTVLATAGNTSPDDPTILTAMLADDRLQSVTTTRTDYTLMNFPTRGM